MARTSEKPSWDKLFATASGQDGLFTTEQAAEAGYYHQLLKRHVEFGRVRRVRRGIYRLVHYPTGEHEELAEIWLWSKQAGVFSHETALSLYELSDVLPKRVHLTVPADWRRRRLKVPRGVVLHHATVRADERSWYGAVPVTEPGRTLLDCAVTHLSPELLGQAFQQARSRGLVSTERLAEISKAAGLREVQDDAPRVRDAGRVQGGARPAAAKRSRAGRHRAPAATARVRSVPCAAGACPRRRGHAQGWPRSRAASRAGADHPRHRPAPGRIARWPARAAPGGGQARPRRLHVVRGQGGRPPPRHHRPRRPVRRPAVPGGVPSRGHALRSALRRRRRVRRSHSRRTGAGHRRRSPRFRRHRRPRVAGVSRRDARRGEAPCLHAATSHAEHARERPAGPALLGQIGPRDARRLRAALEQTFGFRATHPTLPGVPDPPMDWTEPYTAMADEDALPWTTLGDVVAAARGFLDPVLGSNADGSWDPRSWTWDLA